LTDSASSDVGAEADVITTAALLGFAASQVMADSSVRFDLDPLEAKDDATWQEFQTNNPASVVPSRYAQRTLSHEAVARS
jgi:hypothetical protein